MNNIRITFLFCSLLFLQGCAAAALTAGSMAAGQGIDHTLSGISYKTFAASIDEMRVATFKTLARLDMAIISQAKTKSGWEIKAAAYDRVIEIELEALTRRATRMRVVANQGGLFFRDAATATEIIIQTADTLDMEMEAALRAVQGKPEAAALYRRY